MGRTTATEVKQILPTDLADAIVDAYIIPANALVTNVLVGEISDEDLLEEIERWLTAHLIAATQERQSAEVAAGKAKLKYFGVSGKQLEITTYGQQVLILDYTGEMAKLGSKKREVSVYAVPEDY